MAKIKIELSNGKSMTVVIDEQTAPITAQNFLKYVDDGFYSNTIFHRVIPNFMIQGGGFIEGGMGIEDKPATYPPIKGEFLANGVQNPIKHQPGVISMARTQVKNSATSQFFICVADCSFLDGQYASFGSLADEESLKVACDISKVKTHSWGYYDDIPNDPIVIKSVIRVE